MQAPSRLARSRAWVPALLLAGFSSCQVLPPEHAAATGAGSVRASSSERAEDVAALFARLEPAVVRLLPEARTRKLDVWVQEHPALYRFAQRAYQDADGFFSEAADRIHLRSAADNLERTLAHELVHAHLRGAWRALPGTLEEGLCDHVSGELCADGRAALRAGRLSCAAFALGGLALELDVQAPADETSGAARRGLEARLRLEGEPPMEVDPLGVFERQAGLSSSRLTTAHKKAYYGLAYLVAERIVGRIGIDGLHELCAAALRAEETKVATSALLAAAELDHDPAGWKQALLDEFEPGDLRELVRSHPEFLVRTLDEFLASPASEEELDQALAGVRARITLAGTTVGVDLLLVPEVRASLAAVARGRLPANLARR